MKSSFFFVIFKKFMMLLTIYYSQKTKLFLTTNFKQLKF